MLCNCLTQPHFDFACCTLQPNLSMPTYKNKLQTAQAAFIRFSLGIERRSHIGLNHCGRINWLAVSNRPVQCIAVTTNKNICRWLCRANLCERNFYGTSFIFRTCFLALTISLFKTFSFNSKIHIHTIYIQNIQNMTRQNIHGNIHAYIHILNL